MAIREIQVAAGVAAAEGAGVEIARRQVQALGVLERRRVRAVARAGFAVAGDAVHLREQPGPVGQRLHGDRRLGRDVDRLGELAVLPWPPRSD